MESIIAFAIKNIRFHPNERNILIWAKNYEDFKSAFLKSGKDSQFFSQPDGVSIDSIVFNPDPYIGKSNIERNLKRSMNLLKVDGSIYLISHKNIGAESHKKMLEHIFGVENTMLIKKGSGGYALYKAVKKNPITLDTNTPATTIDIKILGQNIKAVTMSGLFSKEGLDNGTKFLLEFTESFIKDAKNILDVGCGWGAIGITSALVNKNANITMIDIDENAVETARKNVVNLQLEKRVKVALTDDPKKVTRDIDLVLSNPPLHEKDEVLNNLFVDTSAVMAPNAKLFIVVENSYVRKFTNILKSSFKSSPTLKTVQNFTVIYVNKQ